MIFHGNSLHCKGPILGQTCRHSEIEPPRLGMEASVKF